ncbi:MAG: hypothetical protein AVDCRST_MAG52-3463, partial [uncultured Blastococcus sp.]
DRARARRRACGAVALDRASGGRGHRAVVPRRRGRGRVGRCRPRRPRRRGGRPRRRRAVPHPPPEL